MSTITFFTIPQINHINAKLMGQFGFLSKGIIKEDAGVAQQNASHLPPYKCLWQEYDVFVEYTDHLQKRRSISLNYDDLLADFEG